MAHFAFVCVPTTGHINPLVATAKELVARGHSATFFHHPDLEPVIRGAGVAFHPIGSAFGGPGSLDAAIAKVRLVKGLSGVRVLLRDFSRGIAMYCEELPDAFGKLKVDMIVSDWGEPAAGLVAYHLGLPFVSICAALPFNSEPGVPAPSVGWAFGATPWHRYRNQVSWRAEEWMKRPLRDVIRTYAERWHLRPFLRVEEVASPFAQIAQLVPALDFPRRSLTGCFHYCGPLRFPQTTIVRRQSGRRTGRAFASLGSLMGHRAEIFERIAEAAEDCGLDLTIAHGGLLAPADVARLSRKASVVDFIPYDEILQNVDVAIMHGGMNGVLDALAHGVPLVVVPLAFDQAAIAARVSYAGAGVICRPRAMKRRLAGAIRMVLADPSFADAADRIGKDIQAAGGVGKAVDIIEQVERTRAPCINAETILGERTLAPFGLQAVR